MPRFCAESGDGSASSIGADIVFRLIRGFGTGRDAGIGDDDVEPGGGGGDVVGGFERGDGVGVLDFSLADDLSFCGLSFGGLSFGGLSFGALSLSFGAFSLWAFSFGEGEAGGGGGGAATGLVLGNVSCWDLGDDQSCFLCLRTNVFSFCNE